MTINYSKTAAKVLQRLDSVTAQRIGAAISKIPYGDIKPLEGVDNTYRLRVGEWRVLFVRIDDDTIRISRIAPRGGAYKGV
jgi:mRNA interferase RelE/StbE